MPYELSFSPDFFGDPYNAKKRTMPKNVADALASMPKKEWNEMARDVFGVPGRMLTIDTVMDKIIETNTCSNLGPRVEVWIDEDGYYSIVVYD